MPHLIPVPRNDPRAAVAEAGAAKASVAVPAAVSEVKPAQLGDCHHCGTTVTVAELQPMKGTGLKGCPTCRARLEVVGHPQRPILPVHVRQLAKQQKDTSA